MVDHVLESHSLDVLSAETDADGLGFYKRLGFSVQSLGDKYPGTERFWCSLHRTLPGDG
jgi:hypothetical protein